MVYVRTSTLDSIEAAVDRNDGAVVIRNAWVRDREGMDRLRITRLDSYNAKGNFEFEVTAGLTADLRTRSPRGADA